MLDKIVLIKIHANDNVAIIANEGGSKKDQTWWEKLFSSGGQKKILGAQPVGQPSGLILKRNLIVRNSILFVPD